jgi:Protein of unknown function (DUF1569)
MAKRRRLKFASAQDVAAEVRRLRRGYERAGNWTLEQICWHLNKALSYSMQSNPNAAAQRGLIRRLQLKFILRTGMIPIRTKAPQRIAPPQQIPEAVVDEFLLTLAALQRFEGPFSPHPIFGQIRVEEFVRFHMIHCGHHLGYLLPAGRN